MYRVIKTSSATLISSDEVIYAIPALETADARIINSCIQIAEERFIKPAICKNLYDDIKFQKNKLVTTANQAFLQSLFPVGADVLNIGEIVNAIEFVSNPWYNSLWNEYLWKLTAECVMYIATPVNFSRFSTQGEMQNNPKNPMEGQDSASVDLATIKWKADKLLNDRIAPLISSVEQWIYDNKGYFPLSDCKNWSTSDDYDGVAIKRKSAYVFGVYDNNTSIKCGCNDDN